MGGKGSLARRLLGWQLVIVFAVLGCVAAVSVAQTNAGFADREGRRLLSAAENVAATPGVRLGLQLPGRSDALSGFAETAHSLSGADFVTIAEPDLRIRAATDLAPRGARLDLGPSSVQRGRSWVGELGGSVVAHVPVLSERSAVVGIVAAGRTTPGFFDGVADSPADAVLLLAVATVLGIAGSVLLARRLKRQTFGLEPREITELVEHREALLRGIREGVLGLDAAHRITLVNERARELLALPENCVGMPVTELESERLRDVLTGKASTPDAIVLRAGRVLVINRLPVSVRGRQDGAVATLRDRTEFVELREELAASGRATDTLRAQAHEYTNRLHTIAGLIELGEYDEVRRYVDHLSTAQDEWHEQVSARIGDSAVAALLIAKASLAAEQGVGLRLDPQSRLGRVTEALSVDLVTVVGNLVDNALDALRGGAAGNTTGDWVQVAINQTETEVTVVVCDSGPGVAPELATEVFRNGFTTKAAQHGNRGLGLALTRQICVRRGGSVDVHNAGGAVFTAVLRLAAAPSEPVAG